MEPGNGRSRTASRQLPLKEQVSRIEKAAIDQALKNNAGNKSRAALELGISYPNLLAKIKRYQLKGY